MGNFRRDDRGDRGGYRGGRSSFRGRSSFNDNRGGDRPMFKAVCDNCGKDCEVPFRPTSGKPVYCSDCFEKMGARSESPRQERPNSNNLQLDAISAKLDRIIALLEPKSEPKLEPKVKKVKKVAKAEKVTPVAVPAPEE